jgi:hypothetical protein
LFAVLLYLCGRKRGFMITVRGLVLPGLLVQLLADGRWRHPGEEKLYEVMPWFEDPLIFLKNADHMASESRSLDMFAADERSSELFRNVRGSDAVGPVELPWLDVELAVLIAVNKMPGDDVAIALDYRTDQADPRVVASDFWTDPSQCAWRTVSPTFSAFTSALGLLAA